MSDCAYRASPDQVILQTSWLGRSNAIYVIFLWIATVFSTLVCINYMRKHPIFHTSTKILLYFALFSANLHDISLVLIKLAVLYRSFYYADDPCCLLFDIDDCYPISRFMFSGIIGLVYVLLALTLDGLYALFLPYHYYKYERISGIVLVVLLFLFMGLVNQIVVPFGFESNEAIPSCQFFPSMFASNANTFLITSFGITVINLMINIFLFGANKHQQRRNEIPSFNKYYSIPTCSRMSFDVVDKYNRHEAIMTSKAVSLLIIAQICALSVYLVGIYTVRINKDQIPVSVYHNIIVWFYAISYASFSLPLLIIFSIKYVRKNRRVSIHNMTSHKESIDNRMNELKEMWS